jgi:hypothetical protein
MEVAQHARFLPGGVVSVGMVSTVMALSSFLLASCSPPAADGHAALLWIVNTDMFCIQNLGHSAFLLMFATSWWRNQNVLGLMMCQLSAAFLLASCVGYILLGLLCPHLLSTIPAGYLALPVVFGVTLLGCLIATSEMASRHKLMVFRWRTYLVVDSETTLRRVLLLQCLLQCLEPSVVAYFRSHKLNSAYDDPLVEDNRQLAEGDAPSEDQALLLRAFMDSYTLGFHQAFVMAAAYSQVLVDDRLRDKSSVVFAIIGQFTLVLAFGVGGFVIPADALFTIITCVRVTMHMGLGLFLVRLHTTTGRYVLPFRSSFLPSFISGPFSIYIYPSLPSLPFVLPAFLHFCSVFSLSLFLYIYVYILYVYIYIHIHPLLPSFLPSFISVPFLL